METDRFRLPWQDGFPEALKESLSPFRKRLEDSYNVTLNAFEIVLEQR